MATGRSPGYGCRGNQPRAAVPSRALVVEPQPILGAALVHAARETLRLREAAWAAGYRDGMRRLEAFRPDLAVLDIALPDGDGLDLVRNLRSYAAPARILVFSALDESVWAARSLAAGANGYLLKSASADEFCEACRKLLCGLSHISPNAATHIANSLMNQGAKGKSGHPTECFSEREMQTYRLLGEGLAGREIAARLHISVKTVETYRQRLKIKLGLDSTRALVVRAVREGGVIGG